MIAVTDLQTPVGDSTPASSSQSRLAEREQLSRAIVRAHQRTATAVVGVEVVDEVDVCVPLRRQRQLAEPTATSVAEQPWTVRTGLVSSS
jgi:hypothetical protein